MNKKPLLHAKKNKEYKHLGHCHVISHTVQKEKILRDRSTNHLYPPLIFFRLLYTCRSDKPVALIICLTVL